MPPTLKVADFMPVDLSTGPVLFATYSPSISTQQHDVTQKVRHLQMTKSRSEIANLQGGIHCHIGDPFPNISKCFRVWFANKPDQTFIIDTQSPSHALMQQKVFISPAMQIVAASYSAACNNEQEEKYVDAVDTLKRLVMTQQQQPAFQGGIPTIVLDSACTKNLVDDHQGDESDRVNVKKLKIWFA